MEWRRRLGRRGASFSTAYYYIAIIGAPSESDPWLGQWGGHLG
jgi:hypothetical protein